MVNFKWKGVKWSYQDVGEAKVIEVQDKDNKICQLEYLKCSEAKEMVGVHSAPN